MRRAILALCVAIMPSIAFGQVTEKQKEWCEFKRREAMKVWSERYAEAKDELQKANDAPVSRNRLANISKASAKASTAKRQHEGLAKVTEYKPGLDIIALPLGFPRTTLRVLEILNEQESVVEYEGFTAYLRGVPTLGWKAGPPRKKPEGGRIESLQGSYDRIQAAASRGPDPNEVTVHKMLKAWEKKEGYVLTVATDADVPNITMIPVPPLVEQAVKKPAEKAEPQDPETLAALKLSQARKFLELGLKDDCRDYCTAIAEKWPNTKAAAEAKTLLGKLK